MTLNNSAIVEERKLVTDDGYFGKGVYFTQQMSYGDFWVKYGETHKNLPQGTPLILSWLLLGATLCLEAAHQNLHPSGNAYPVVEKHSLFGQPLKPGYDSHFVLVKKSGESNTSEFYPCDPEKEAPDYDEIIIANPHQILPRYLIYYSQLDIKHQRTLLWIDPNTNSNSGLVAKICSYPVNVIQLPDLVSMIQFLFNQKSTSDIRIITNRARPEDGGESAGVRTCQWILNHDDYKHIPIMIYCGNPSLVADLPPGAQLTNDPALLFEFATQNLSIH